MISNENKTTVNYYELRLFKQIGFQKDILGSRACWKNDDLVSNQQLSGHHVLPIAF
jgi:hypothetical protein